MQVSQLNKSQKASKNAHALKGFQFYFYSKLLSLQKWRHLKYEPPRGKTNNVVSEQV